MTLAVRALVPQGFMIEQADDLTLSVRICSPTQPGHLRTVEISVPRDGEPDRDDRQKEDNCPFSTLAAPATLLGKVVLPDRDHISVDLAPSQYAALGLSGRFRWRPPLRAPPHLSV
jgi:hypothetical protein